MKLRLKLGTLIGVSAMVVAIVMTMVKYAIVESDSLKEFANAQQLSSKIVEATRGTIYDANGDVLARSATVYTVFVDPGEMEVYLSNLSDKNKASMVNEDGSRVYVSLDEICFNIGEILDIDPSEVRERALKDSRYEILMRNVEKTTADKIWDYLKKHKINAIDCQASSKRFYSQNELAAAVIGHLNFDGQGIYGLEAYYDEYLMGVDGRTVYARDRDGNEIPYEYKQSYDAQSGNSLKLNLDITIQRYLEKALNDAVDLNKPNERACGIIMNCNTGAVLAMATSPGYNLNAPAEIYDQKTALELAGIANEEDYNAAKLEAWSIQWKNKAITEIYNPGSVFKVITGSSALEEGAINLNQTFGCTTSITVADREIGCWSSKAHGYQNLSEAMVHSCNPAFVQIGQAIGAEGFSKYFKAYGFTERTGIDLPGEGNSIFMPLSRMGPVELASCSFGQTNKVTPIQMITAYAACINGGYLLTPQVVDKIVDSDTGNVVKDIQPVVKRQVISEETSKTMREILENVVNTETGSNSYIKGYRIGGKSGTSQKIDVDVTGNTYVSSYCAFAPADDPEIIMLVMVDDPTGEKYYGSQVAAPIVTQVLEELLPYMGYFPEYTEEELKQLSVSVPLVELQIVDTAVATLEASNLNAVVIGNGAKVVKQVPASGTIPRGCQVILYTEEDYEEEYTTVPNLYGKTLSQTEDALLDAGLNYEPTGSARYEKGSVCSSQNYKEGDIVPKGTIITVGFSQNEASSQ
ncbi:MAG: PASTA domain-containing protein [Ruminococcus sp.]|nr:PASTA domain-containing protein [Ruminococcus sp.]